MILLILRDFNFKLKLICYYIENIFDICKDRFRLLTFSRIRKIQAMVAIFTISNFLVDINDNIGIESEEIEDEYILDNNDYDEGMEEIEGFDPSFLDIYHEITTRLVSWAVSKDSHSQDRIWSFIRPYPKLWKRFSKYPYHYYAINDQRMLSRDASLRICRNASHRIVLQLIVRLCVTILGYTMKFFPPAHLVFITLA